MRVLCLLVFVVVCSSSPFSSELKETWEQYKVKYGRNYDAQEEGARRLTWEQNVRKINKHNLEADLGLHTYWMGVNHFTDKTVEEWNKLRSCMFKPRNATKSGEKAFVQRFNLMMPNSVDWRDKGYVTDVKNQKECGSCWAFSATGALEGQHKAVSGNLVSLSEQNLVDCSWDEGNMGCSGGLMDNAFQYVIDNHGIDTEKSYPYRGVDSDCKFNPATVGATCKSYADVTPGEKNLQAAVTTVGPISVGIEASDKFMHYKSGVFYDSSCTKQLNHGVLVVGYGSDGGKDYWIVKNSWSKSWGMQGYVWMARNRNNNCGIASMPSYPIM